MEHTLNDLREIVIKELDEINRKGELDENSLVCAYKLIDILKDIGEVEEHEMGYSSIMDPYPMGNGNSYRGGYNNRYSMKEETAWDVIPEIRIVVTAVKVNMMI